MSRLRHLTAFSAVIAAVGFLSFTTSGARADSKADNVHVNGSYHSVRNGIRDYEGFDRFRDANGNRCRAGNNSCAAPGDAAMRGLKRCRMYAIVLGLGWAAAATPAFADTRGAGGCTWQPIVRGLRHLVPPADLEAKELNCGIVDPVDLSPEIAATDDRLGERLRAAPGHR